MLIWRGRKAVLEVDLAQPAGAPGFVTRHSLSTRSVLDLEIACDGCDPAAVVVEVTKAVQGVELDGAVVRVRLEHLDRDAWAALDFGEFDALFAGCLHRSVQLGRSGLHMRDDEHGDDAELHFETWARARIPSGTDPERVIAIARTHLDEAADAEVEQATE